MHILCLRQKEKQVLLNGLTYYFKFVHDIHGKEDAQNNWQ